MNSIVKDKLPQLVALCEKYSVVRMYLFGSAARDDFNEATSDIDLLIAFSSQLTMEEYADNYLDLVEILDNLFGRQVDLVTEKQLASPYFIENVERDKQLIYVA